jgi:hypothetical protein
VLDRLDPLDRLSDRPHEQEAAHLAVADDVDTRALLQGDHLIDRTVLQALEVVCREAALLERSSALLQVRRAKQRSDHLGAKHERPLRSQAPTTVSRSASARITSPDDWAHVSGAAR